MGMTIKEIPNKITAVLKVTATAEFFDDESSEETVRYCIEQDLEDAGFDVDVTLLKEQEAVKPKLSMNGLWYECPVCNRHLTKNSDNYCARCGRPVLWEERREEDNEVYGYCQFCGRKNFGQKRYGNWFGEKIEYFICLDCDKITY